MVLESELNNLGDIILSPDHSFSDSRIEEEKGRTSLAGSSNVLLAAFLLNPVTPLSWIKPSVASPAGDGHAWPLSGSVHGLQTGKGNLYFSLGQEVSGHLDQTTSAAHHTAAECCPSVLILALKPTAAGVALPGHHQTLTLLDSMGRYSQRRR